MSSHHTPNHSPVGAEHHVQSVGTYTAVFFALLVLMGLTILASEVTIVNTAGNNIVALAIAVIKASLVVAIFMGVRHSPKLVRFWAISGLCCILLFIFIGIDFWSRGNEAIKGFYGDEGSGLHTGHLPNDPSTMKPVSKEEYEKNEEQIQKNR